MDTLYLYILIAVRVINLYSAVLAEHTVSSTIQPTRSSLEKSTLSDTLYSDTSLYSSFSSPSEPNLTVYTSDVTPSMVNTLSVFEKHSSSTTKDISTEIIQQSTGSLQSSLTQTPQSSHISTDVHILDKNSYNSLSSIDETRISTTISKPSTENSISTTASKLSTNDLSTGHTVTPAITVISTTYTIMESTTYSNTETPKSTTPIVRRSSGIGPGGKIAIGIIISTIVIVAVAVGVFWYRRRRILGNFNVPYRRWTSYGSPNEDLQLQMEQSI